MVQDLNRDVVRALDRQRHVLAEMVVSRQYELQPEIWSSYGDVGWDKSLRDAGYHLSYLAESIAGADPMLFVDYVAWVKVLFAGLGFPEQVFAVTLNCTREVVKETLPEPMASLAGEYLEAGLTHLQQAPSSVPAFIDSDMPLADLSHRYLDALLLGERHVASQLVLDAVESGASVKDIYLCVFQRCQYEIGRLWQMNRISVAQEHYCTAATQLIMSQLYPYIFATEKTGGRFVAACVGGELHEIGARMVADFFEMEGWDTYYLGANTPAEAIVQQIEERRADVLGISATMTFHVRAVESLIEQVRASDVGARVKILVGGYPFQIAPELWQRLGADGYGRDAQEAVAVAHRLVREGAQA
jgi:methylmalonyl-CoA mutase cobalamin-binding domain/chain